MAPPTVAGLSECLRRTSLQWTATVMTAIMVIAAGAPAGAAEVAEVVVERSRSVAPDRDADPVLNNLERRTFRFFWNTANKQERPRAGSLSDAVVREHRRSRLRTDCLCRRR